MGKCDAEKRTIKVTPERLGVHIDVHKVAASRTTADVCVPRVRLCVVHACSPLCEKIALSAMARDGRDGPTPCGHTDQAHRLNDSDIYKLLISTFGARTRLDNRPVAYL